MLKAHVIEITKACVAAFIKAATHKKCSTNERK